MLNIGALVGDLRIPAAARVGGGVGIYELNGVLTTGLTFVAFVGEVAVGGATGRIVGAKGAEVRVLD